MDYVQKQLELLKDGRFGEFVSIGMPHIETESKNRRDFFSRGVTWDPPLKKWFGKDDYEVAAIYNSEPDYSNCEILNKAQRNISKIRLLNIDIRDALNQGTYTKVFLSNTVGYKEQQFEFASQIFLALAGSLESNGLFYSTIGNRTSEFMDKAYSEGIIPEGTFILDTTKTKSAARLQADALQRIQSRGGQVYTWNPRVYQKV